MAAALGRSVCPDAARTPLATAPLLPVCSAPPLPDGPCPVCPRLALEFEPWRQAGYWKALPGRALQREALLQQEIEQLRAQLRLREQQLFGRKTETSAATTPRTTAPGSATPPRRRGQQPGRPAPRRRNHAHLPTVVEEHTIPAEQCCCQRCGRPLRPCRRHRELHPPGGGGQGASPDHSPPPLSPDLRLRRAPRRRHRSAGP